MNKVYLTDTSSRTMYIINGTNDTPINIVPMTDAGYISFNPHTNLIYNSGYYDKHLSVINASIISTTKSSTIPVGNGPADMAIDSNTNKAYVVNNGDYTVSIIPLHATPSTLKVKAAR